MERHSHISLAINLPFRTHQMVLFVLREKGRKRKGETRKVRDGLS